MASSSSWPALNHDDDEALGEICLPTTETGKRLAKQQEAAR